MSQATSDFDGLVVRIRVLREARANLDYALRFLRLASCGVLASEAEAHGQMIARLARMVDRQNEGIGELEGNLERYESIRRNENIGLSESDVASGRSD